MASTRRLKSMVLKVHSGKCQDISKFCSQVRSASELSKIFSSMVLFFWLFQSIKLPNNPYLAKWLDTIEEGLCALFYHTYFLSSVRFGVVANCWLRRLPSFATRLYASIWC